MTKKTQKPLMITVIGEGEASPEIFKLAEQVGEELARAGVVVICGGLTGVMEGVCKGAKKEGGTTIAVLPGSRREEANQYVDYPIVTGIGYARNKLVVKSGQAVIAVGGSYGTLSEIAFALGYGIPIVGLQTWELIHRTGRKDQKINYVTTAKEAVDLAVKLAKEAGPTKNKREFST